MLTPIEKLVLAKLFARGAIGSNHYRIDTLLHMGWKAHERGEVKDAINHLLRLGYIQWYNRSKEAIQLNDELLDEIKDILDDNYGRT